MLVDGEAEVVIVADPADEGLNRRSVSLVRIYNDDSVSHTFTVRVRNTARQGFQDEYLNILPDVLTLGTKETVEVKDRVAELDQGQTLVLEQDAAYTTDPPQWLATWIDE